MKAGLLVYGFLVFGLVAYANWRGWRILDFGRSGRWAPSGQSMYHK